MNKFIEINEVSKYNYCPDSLKGTKQETTSYRKIILGKVLINFEQIKCVSVASWNWKDTDHIVVDEKTITYSIKFENGVEIYTDVESYNKIKNLVIDNSKNNI